jgi:putative FmdB family regulatory protein
MPIYAYKCESCGHRQDVLQKISDPVLTTCTACGQPAFVKQVTAAGFQLKGSGWYVTDFRDGGGKKGDKSNDKPEGDPSAAGKPAETAAAPAGEASPAAAPAAAPAPASAPAAGTTSAAPAASAPSA